MQTLDWSIIIPEEATNLVENPSSEYDLTGYTNTGGTIVRTNADARIGAYSVKCTASGAQSGFYYDSVPLASGTAYTLSFFANVPNGVDMLFRIWKSDFTPITVFNYAGTGEWKRYDFEFTSSETANYLLIFVTSTATNTVWYTDGLNVTAGDYLQTYIDGDQEGCYWNGAEHLSPSTRDSQFRNGGKIVNFGDYGIYGITPSNTGMTTPEHITMNYGGLVDGALYQGTRQQPRVFQLLSNLTASGQANLHVLRDVLQDAVKINLVGKQQELTLRYTGANTIRDVRAVYDGGLEFNSITPFAEALPLRFVANDPYWYDEAYSQAAITPAVTISGAYIFKRDRNGNWSNLGSTYNAGVKTIAYDKKHNLFYFGGDFTSPQSRVSKYDPETNTFTFMGTGAADGSVQTLWVDQTNGDVYAGGSFSLMGGVARTKGIARWDYATQAWKPLASGILNNRVYSIVQGNDRTVYIGGDFTLMSGIANTSRIARYNPTTGIMSALGTGMNDPVKEMVITADGYLASIGSFTTSNGVNTYGLAKWTGSTFEAIGGGINPSSPDGEMLAVAKDGALYAGTAGADINPTGALSYGKLAKYTGSQWISLGTGISSAVYTGEVDKNGNLLVAGEFFVAGGLTLPSTITIWNNSAFYPLGIVTPTVGTIIHDVFINSNDDIYIALLGNNTSISEAITTVTNDGKADAYPKIIIDNPTASAVTLYYVKNYTTGETIYFNTAMVLNANERMTLDLVSKTFSSNFQGKLDGKIIPGSNFGSFRLLSGVNTISFFGSSTSIVVNFVWKNRYLSFDGGAKA